MYQYSKALDEPKIYSGVSITKEKEKKVATLKFIVVRILIICVTGSMIHTISEEFPPRSQKGFYFFIIRSI